MKTYTEFLTEKATYKKFEHSSPTGKEIPGAEGSEGALKYVKQVNGKWALVSRHTGRPLKYFESKPSKEAADSALRAVEFYKHS